MHISIEASEALLRYSSEDRTFSIRERYPSAAIRATAARGGERRKQQVSSLNASVIVADPVALRVSTYVTSHSLQCPPFSTFRRLVPSQLRTHITMYKHFRWMIEREV
ncbi:hypothetical protein LshimejAT787_0504430 [Lyophyllum shimeji]|uniref:Uncharacterized protein n=1 Tax=Lyophyllum shimeji TaxID=47721 RepID=A0A9P3PME0_LYOSH|nr:hypothetical protein LshimejAT787_0504430 [Lyophyllum shimeji]